MKPLLYRAKSVTPVALPFVRLILKLLTLSLDICKLSIDFCIFSSAEDILGLPCWLPEYVGFSGKHTEQGFPHGQQL